MTFDGLHEILIISDDTDECAVLLAAVVEKTTKSFTHIGGRSVLINMRERGSETLQSPGDISLDMEASKKAERFSLCKALESPRYAPGTAELSLRSSEGYYGRLRIRCVTPEEIPEEGHIDAVMLASDSAGETAVPLLPEGVGIVSAVYCGSPGEKSDGAVPYLIGKRFYRGVYNPYGFVGGRPHRADCADPYGIEELFRHLVLFAAMSRYEQLCRVIESSKKVIARRSGVFSRGSIRSFLELEKAREDYSAAVRDIYSSEQLILLLEKNRLICGSEEGNEA